MAARSPSPSPDGAASGQEAVSGVAEAAGRVLNPPGALAALPRPLTSRRQLDRLRRALHREGWRTERRYCDAVRMLRVYSPGTSCIGESVTVVGINGEWWYRASTGELLAPCSQIDLAVSRIASLLMPWVSAAASSRRSGSG